MYKEAHEPNSRREGVISGRQIYDMLVFLFLFFFLLFTDTLTSYIR